MNFEEYLHSIDLSVHSISLYSSQARKFENYLNGRCITADLLKDYINILTETHSPGTINTYIIAINHYLKWKGCIQFKRKTRKIQKKQSLDNVLSKEEYQTLLSYAKESGREKYYLIMRVLAGTGMRISELLSMTVDMIRNNQIIVYNKSKYREIYIAESLKTEILKYCENKRITTGYIFKGRKTETMNRHSIWEMLKKLADMTGVPQEHVYPHSFRHLFAKTYMMKYGNIAELASLLGHSSLEVTRIYTLTSAAEKRKEIEQLGL